MHKHLKRSLQYGIEAGIAWLVFLLMLMFLPKDTTKEVIQKDNMHFVIHESANEREDFFDENDLDEILTWEMREEVLAMLEADSKDTIEISKTSDVMNKENNITSNTNREDKKSCKLPRIWKDLQHSEFVLTYRQRRDVSSICEVERRFCNDWVLLWSFTQRSCKENIDYQYSKDMAIPYNSLPTNPYLQPAEITKNYYSEFDTKWKINWSYPQTKTNWNNSINHAVIYDKQNTSLKKYPGIPDCTTPRDETISHMQFVKAYKDSEWYRDYPCEVELRYMIVWVMSWNQKSMKNQRSWIWSINCCNFFYPGGLDCTSELRKLLEIILPGSNQRPKFS